MLRPAQCASDQSCHFDSSVSVMIPEDVTWRDEAYVSDVSHRSAMHDLFALNRLNFSRLAIL
jgi:hypothetical protein